MYMRNIEEEFDHEMSNEGAQGMYNHNVEGNHSVIGVLSIVKCRIYIEIASFALTTCLHCYVTYFIFRLKKMCLSALMFLINAMR